MKKEVLLEKLIFRLKVCSIILFLISIWEVLYWLGTGSRLAFILMIFAVTCAFGFYTLKVFFEEVGNYSKNKWGR